MTYAESLGTISTAIAVVRFFRPDGLPCGVVTCYNAEAIIYAVGNHRYQSDLVKVQVI
jgi:hypothetical protein